MKGIEREVDKLGRVVIPIEYRKNLGIEKNATVIVSLEESAIIVTPKQKRCLICQKPLTEEGRYQICENCLSEIRSHDETK